MFSYVLDPPHFTMESRPFSSHLDSSSSPFFPFSPLVFNQDNTFHDLFFTNPQLGGGGGETQPPLTTPIAPLPPNKELAPSPNKKGDVMSRKRATRKDRHSKIVTAQGPRDRRMRLNLEVAPQFFDIQDMLGFDKASKTVKWLMTEAKASIENLRAATRPPKVHSMSGGGNSKSTEASSELECEDMSTISNYKGKSAASKQVNIITTKATRGQRRPSSRKASYPSSLAKESRAMARARARERTRQKKNVNLLFSNSVPFEAIDEEYSGSHDLKSSLETVAEVEEKYSPSTNQSTQVNDGERENELSVSILDYDNNVCSHDTADFFPSEQWGTSFGSIEDDQIETRLWA